MSPQQICKTWAWGIFLGSSAYMFLHRFHIGTMAVAAGIWFGALATTIAFWIKE